MPKLVGMNHIALEVDDVDEALEFWRSIFGELELRGHGRQMAFIDMGDQFIALARGRTQPPDRARHFGLVVDDKEAVRERLREPGIVGPQPGLLRSVGEPDPGRRLPRRAVHEDARGPERARPGRLGEIRGCKSRAAHQRYLDVSSITRA